MEEALEATRGRMGAGEEEDGEPVRCCCGGRKEDAVDALDGLRERELFEDGGRGDGVDEGERPAERIVLTGEGERLRTGRSEMFGERPYVGGDWGCWGRYCGRAGGGGGEGERTEGRDGWRERRAVEAVCTDE